MKIRVLLGVSVVLIVALLSSIGCSQSPDQNQALKEQQQKNGELQKELDAQKKEQEEVAKQEEAARQEELQQKVTDLEKKMEENESQETNQPEPQSNPPDVVIESNRNWTAPPSQAPQGVVVVSPNFDVQAVNAEEAQVIDSAIAYYQEAEIGDYYTTYSLLSEGDQNFYSVDEWVEANTVLDSAAAEFVVTDAYPEDIGNGSSTYAVMLTAYSPDGSSFSRTTYFTNEGNGYWAHWLTGDEMDLFNSAL